MVSTSTVPFPAIPASAATTSLNSKTPGTCCHCTGTRYQQQQLALCICGPRSVLKHVFSIHLDGQGLQEQDNPFGILAFSITCLCGLSQTPYTPMPYPVTTADNTNLSQSSLRLCFKSLTVQDPPNCRLTRTNSHSKITL